VIAPTADAEHHYGLRGAIDRAIADWSPNHALDDLEDEATQQSLGDAIHAAILADRGAHTRRQVAPAVRAPGTAEDAATGTATLSRAAGTAGPAASGEAAS
jgi:hypothetical protein